MKRIAAVVLSSTAFALFAAMLPGLVVAADAPADRVVAMYFHRTQRCPTCQKMGSFSDEAVKTGFADQIKDGCWERKLSIALHDIFRRQFVCDHKQCHVADRFRGRGRGFRPQPDNL